MVEQLDEQEDDADVLVWDLVIDKITNDGKMIGWERSEAQVWATTEAEAREIAAEHWPEFKIYSIKRAPND